MLFRAAVAALVEDKDIGKVFSQMAVVQAVSTAVAPLYTLLYWETKDYYDSLIYCINSTVLILVALGAVYATWYFKNRDIGDSGAEGPARIVRTARRVSTMPEIKHTLPQNVVEAATTD